MAAQVDVPTGEVGRSVVGGRLRLSPLTDSSNTSLIEIPSMAHSRIIASEPSKPVPGPKPRLTPKPFLLEKNPIIKPIVAPKPQTNPRSDSTHRAGQKPQLSCSPKPQQAGVTGKSRPGSAAPNRPGPTSFRTSPKLTAGQTIKPVVHPFKPAPPLDLVDISKPRPPEKKKAGGSNLTYSKSLKNCSAAEWAGTTKKEEEEDRVTSSRPGVSITRAKSTGYLAQMVQEDEETEKDKPEAAVPLRPQPRGSRPRPVSAVFLSSPAKTETQSPAPHWAERRPLSADLTSKFESIGLSLHRKTPKANTKENTPEENVPPQRRQQEKPSSSPDVANPSLSEPQSDKNESDEDKGRVSIRSRISLLLDSSCSPGTGAAGQTSDLLSPVQPTSETDQPGGVKRLIKQLTEDATPTQSAAVKPLLKPRPLPLDLTKR